MWFTNLHFSLFHCASHSSSPGLREVKARLLWMYILDAAKQVPFLLGGDVIRGGPGIYTYSGSRCTAV